MGGHGRGSMAGVGPVYQNDARIWISGGHERITNCHAEWELVPHDEQTHEERVRGAWLSWQKPDWLDAAETPHEPDECLFYVMSALLTEAEWETMFPENGDHPVGYFDLTVDIARVMDERAAVARLGGQSDG
jgi:hypothetical protein